MRLKDRGKFPPGGFRYYVAQTNFSISPWISFDAAVQQILAHRKANPHQCAVNGWSLDPTTIANELDDYNVKVCQSMNWDQYITDGSFDDIPKRPSPPSLLPRNVGRVAAGIKTILEWEIAGGAVVDQETANARARVCAGCPKNELGDLSTWFTEQAAELLRAQLGKKNEMKLVTDQDPTLGLCQACGCVNKLKVWCPSDIILAKLKPEIKAALHESCWITSEERVLSHAGTPA